MVEHNRAPFSRLLWKYLPWLILLILVLVITVLYAAIVDKSKKIKTLSRQEKVDRPAVNVVTQIIEPITMQDKLSLPATVYAWEDLVLKTEVQGKIVGLDVEEGDQVTEGQRIAEIDKGDYRNKLEEFRSRYELARIKYERLQKLFEAEAVPRAQLDEARYKADELKAALAAARLNLERCDITAPMSGVINSVPVSRGDIVAFGDPVAQLLKIDPLKADVAIPEVDAPQVRDIAGSRLTFSALGGKEIYADKIFFSSQPREPAMVYILRLRLDNAEGEILPGMFARAEIIKRNLPDSIAVPLYAVITRDDQKFVYVVEGDNVRKQEVRTGILEGWKIRITSGLSPQDEVVIVGHRGIEEGQQINIVKTVRDPGRIIRNGSGPSIIGAVPDITGSQQNN